MSNRDFEDNLKERLYNYAEPAEPEGWERLLADMGARKRRKVVFRRFLYGTTAVAAAVVAFLLLLPGILPDAAPEREPAITLVNPAEMEAQEATRPAQPVLLASLVESKEEAILFVEEKEVEEVTEVVKDTVEVPMVISATQPQDSTGSKATPSRVNTQSIPDYRYANEMNDERYKSRFRSASDGWSIALVSAYSNAAGEAPFGPTVQVATGRTRIYAVSVSAYENQEYTSLSFSPPVSMGLNFQKELYPWLSIGVGVNYTLLQSKFSNSYNYIGDLYTIRQSLHYVGLPLSALFNFVHQPKLRVYASAGGMVEKAVTAHSSSASKLSSSSENSYVQGLQWSVHAGLGVELLFSRLIGLYLEPGVGYFFDCEQPRSIRTLQPTQFKAELGLRVRI